MGNYLTSKFVTSSDFKVFLKKNTGNVVTFWNKTINENYTYIYIIYFTKHYI